MTMVTDKGYQELVGLSLSYCDSLRFWDLWVLCLSCDFISVENTIQHLVDSLQNAFHHIHPFISLYKHTDRFSTNRLIQFSALFNIL